MQQVLIADLTNQIDCVFVLSMPIIMWPAHLFVWKIPTSMFFIYIAYMLHFVCTHIVSYTTNFVLINTHYIHSMFNLFKNLYQVKSVVWTNLNFQCHMSLYFFCVQCFEVRVGCLICWPSQYFDNNLRYCISLKKGGII